MSHHELAIIIIIGALLLFFWPGEAVGTAPVATAPAYVTYRRPGAVVLLVVLLLVLYLTGHL